MPSGHRPDGMERTSAVEKGAWKSCVLSRSERRVAARHRPVACSTHCNRDRYFGVQFKLQLDLLRIFLALYSNMRRLTFSIFASLILTIPFSLLGQQTNLQVAQIRFLDSATGFGVAANIAVQPAGELARDFLADLAGRATLNLEPGDYALSISSTNYFPMSAAISIDASNANLQFVLDPIAPPAEIQPQKITDAHRPDAMIFVGFVSGANSGQPLSHVRVASLPSGVETTTDARGFFQISIPLQSEAERAVTPATLVFSRDGYKSQERQNIELSPFGDLTLLVSMKEGAGSEIIDEKGRQISPTTEAFTPQPKNQTTFSSRDAARSLSPTNSTVRLPTNIRVLLSDNVTIEYVSMETYVRRSLNDEWISSWGNLAGGSGINSLKAGAVAIRSYAASYVRSPRGSTYDICATTSCQVYDSDTATTTDNAASQTAGYVVLDSANSIARSEYSAENNSDGFACGDGYTAPTGACVYDPACGGEVRFGHGRGMCQWGTARWATGYKMTGRNSGDSTTNGFPKQDWIWMVNHYYPTLTLVQARPFVIGDDVKAVSTTNVRECPGGGIESGVNCSSIASKSAGATGLIIGGPIQVSSDGSGYTWWQIQWSDSVVGWSVENYLERIVPTPAAPSGLGVTVISATQINLNWTDTTDFENGFRIERAPAAAGPWLQIAEVAANLTSFSDTNVTAGNTFYYRVRAFNVIGNSAYSNMANGATPGVLPVLPAIANKFVSEETLLTFTNTATATDVVQMLADFEGFDTETSSGSVLLRNPKNSGTTSANIDAAPDYSSVTTLFPTGAALGAKVLFVHCDFTNATTPWLRLTTASAPNIPNPVIDFTKKFQFRIYCDKAIQVGLGLRETITAAGTPIGSDGGTTGASIEWAGVTNKNGSAPMPARTVPANVWTTLTFDLPNEPVVSFSSGNGILSTASGLGVLEHLAIVPLAGVGEYKMFFDNFAVLRRRILTYTLDPGAPTNAVVNPSTGVFTWTPNEAQGPGTYNITVRATDDSSPPLSATRTFGATVGEINSAPLLAANADRTIHAGNTVLITNVTSDSDLPANTLTYSLVLAPPGATIGASNGIFSWTPTDADVNTTNSISVQVTDNGSPPLTDIELFTITVVARPELSAATVNDGSIQFSWNAIPGNTYRVQFKNDLTEAAWTDLQGVVASSATASFSEPIGTTQRFYRLIGE